MLYVVITTLSFRIVNVLLLVLNPFRLVYVKDREGHSWVPLGIARFPATLAQEG